MTRLRPSWRSAGCALVCLSPSHASRERSGLPLPQNAKKRLEELLEDVEDVCTTPMPSRGGLQQVRVHGANAGGLWGSERMGRDRGPTTASECRSCRTAGWTTSSRAWTGGADADTSHVVAPEAAVVLHGSTAAPVSLASSPRRINAPFYPRFS